MGVLDPNVYQTATGDAQQAPGGGFFESTLQSVLGAATEYARFKYGLKALEAQAKAPRAQDQIPPREDANGATIAPALKAKWLNWAIGGGLLLGGLYVAKRVF